MPNISKDWWVFYPYKGLKITDKKSNIDKPMFGRYHVISPEHFGDIAERMHKSNIVVGKGKKSLYSADDYKKILTAIGEDFDCLIGVKQKAKDSSNIGDMAQNDAEKFAALISLVGFVEKWHIHYGGLLKNLSKSAEEKFVAFCIGQNTSVSIGRWQQHKRGREIYVGLSHNEYSRKQLKQSILNPHIGFGKLLLSDTNLKNDSISVLENAILTLDSAIREKDNTIQLLSCVTTMEILFQADENSNYNQLESRLEMLLNKATTRFLKVSEILKTRHDFVHKGKKLEDKNLIHKAVTLAIVSLISFANGIIHFPNRGSFYSYLDALSAIDKYYQLNKTAKPNSFNALHKKIRSEYIKLQKVEHTKHFVYPDNYFL